MNYLEMEWENGSPPEIAAIEFALTWDKLINERDADHMIARGSKLDLRTFVCVRLW